MRLSELLDRPVETEDGRALGRIFELRARRVDGELVVEDLLLGRTALAERFGLGRHRPAANRHDDTIHEVPWNAVVRIEPTRVIVRRDLRRRDGAGGS